MLVNLLNLLTAGGVHPVSEMARALGVSEELTQQMITDLTQ
jgi:Mn-dependent DtxR family transcriptional regulator